MLKLNLKPRTTIIIPAVITLLIFLGFQVLTHTPALSGLLRPSAPFVQKESYPKVCPLGSNGIDIISGIPDCSCPDIAVYPVGFPFRSNHYDWCGTDDKRVTSVVIVNYLLQAVVLGSVFLGINRALRRMS